VDRFSACRQFQPWERSQRRRAEWAVPIAALIRYDQSAVQNWLKLGIADHFKQRGMKWNSTSHCLARSTSVRWTTT
jgi:hypothetical protein